LTFFDTGRLRAGGTGLRDLPKRIEDRGWRIAFAGKSVVKEPVQSQSSALIGDGMRFNELRFALKNPVGVVGVVGGAEFPNP
jgi:hypothetical protein